MMSSRVGALLFSLALLSGCTQLPVRDYVKMTRSVSFEPKDAITQPSDARSVFALLKSVNHFPDENYSDIFVRDASLELVGPLGAPAVGIDNSVLQAREDAIARAIPGVNAGNPALTRTAASDDHGVIWFAKISAIELSRMTLFLKQAQGYVKDMTGYICFLRMSNGVNRYFRSTNEGDIKRLGAAFSYASGVPVSASNIYPKAGARIAMKDAVLVAVEIDGPFDVAGIPVGSKVLGIDGLPGQDPTQLIKRLGDLKTGRHSIEFQDVLTLATATKEIDLGN